MSKIIDELAPQIHAEIQKADSILLSCHPSPDSDSVGSVLAMKFALESLGKKVAAIRGDSEIPEAFMHFPGAKTILPKNISEIDLGEFDLFIMVDASAPDRISALYPPAFPLVIPAVLIDHHQPLPSFATVSLIDPTYPATAQLLFDLFKMWNIPLTHDTALNLFMGIYTDTGGFRFSSTNSATFLAASELVKNAPDFSEAISIMHDSKKEESLIYQGLALASLKTFFDERIAITAVPFEQISKNAVTSGDISATAIPNILLSVSKFQVAISLSEREPGIISISSRSKNPEKFDVSQLMAKLGGGGHKAAAGARLLVSFDQAVAKVVETAKMLYNL